MSLLKTKYMHIALLSNKNKNTRDRPDNSDSLQPLILYFITSYLFITWLIHLRGACPQASSHPQVEI